MPLRGRFFFAALLLIPLNAFWIIQSEVMRYAGHPTTISLFYNTIFWLCVLLALNGLVGRFFPKAVFSRLELLTLYAMLNICSALAGHDTIEVLLPILAYPVYRANATNNWEQDLIPRLPKHLVVTDKDALKPYFEGHSTLYQADHLRAWLMPTLSWCGFLTTMVVLFMFLNVLLRRRWTESEKLAFPLIQLPLELTAPGAPLLKNKVLWAGILIAVVLQLWNGVAVLNPQVPLIQLKYVDQATNFPTRPWSAIGWLPVGFYPFGIALGVLLPVDLIFSSWFFYLFWKLQLVISAWLAWDQTPNFPYTDAQALGAYLGIGIGAIWAARRHFSWLARVFFNEEKETPDPNDPISQKSAVWGVLVCLALLVIFFRLSGLSFLVIAVAMIIYLGIAIAVTRMRAELGPPVHDLHHAGADTMLPKIFGPTAFSREDHIGLSFWWGFNRAYRGHPMPIGIESLKMAEQSKLGTKGMFYALIGAAVLGPLCAFWALLHLSYAYGAAGAIAPPNVMEIFGREAWNRYTNWTGIPEPPHPQEGMAVLVGLGFTLVLNMIRGRWIGFPFHPVGYAIASSWGMSVLWVPMLVAWVVKILILRYGGLGFYRKCVPFFLGIILGECLMGGFWNLTGIAREVPTYAFWP
ncbi:DUF6785 family protein [Armatimonas sp.]|uniref:DUF6785 family protein n=1 Tax=Armatimonas sp. TaxID=1872638 RepID=UPI00375376B9